MNITIKQTIKRAFSALLYTVVLGTATVSGAAQDEENLNHSLPGAELDFSINYYNRELTSEGVVRESHYTENRLRRHGHVWSYRVIPTLMAEQESVHAKHDHKEFNYVVLPRHVQFDGRKNVKLTVDFIDTHGKQLIHILPTEFENVNFDGSWINTYYLIAPELVATMPYSKKASNIVNARWHEMKKNGLFQRVLWDSKRLIPLIIETGDQKQTFFQRISITSSAQPSKSLPWLNLQGYAHKEYSDFLD